MKLEILLLLLEILFLDFWFPWYQWVQVCRRQSELGSAVAALPVPRVVAAQPEASTSLAPGSLGLAWGAPGSPRGAPNSTLGRPIRHAVISHLGVRGTSNRQVGTAI